MGVDDDTLSFQMYFPTDPGDDGDDTDKSTRCHLIEHYRDSAAASAHERNMQKNQDRNKAIYECEDSYSVVSGVRRTNWYQWYWFFSRMKT